MPLLLLKICLDSDYDQYKTHFVYGCNNIVIYNGNKYHPDSDTENVFLVHGHDNLAMLKLKRSLDAV